MIYSFLFLLNLVPYDRDLSRYVEEKTVVEWR